MPFSKELSLRGLVTLAPGGVVVFVLCFLWVGGWGRIFFFAWALVLVVGGWGRMYVAGATLDRYVWWYARMYVSLPKLDRYVRRYGRICLGIAQWYRNDKRNIS